MLYATQTPKSCYNRQHKPGTSVRLTLSGRGTYREVHMQSILSDVQACGACNALKPATGDFFRLSHRTGKPLRKCRECERAERKVWYAANAETCRNYSVAWRAANPGRRRDRNRHNAYMRGWYRNNQEKWYATNHAARARKHGVFDRHTAEDVQRQLVIQGGRCFYCHLDFETEVGERYTVDHFIPLSKGGSNAPLNIVCACHRCNSRKQDHLPWEWIPERFSKPEGWE